MEPDDSINTSEHTTEEKFKILMTNWVVNLILDLILNLTRTSRFFKTNVMKMGGGGMYVNLSVRRPLQANRVGRGGLQSAICQLSCTRSVQGPWFHTSPETFLRTEERFNRSWCWRVSKLVVIGKMILEEMVHLQKVQLPNNYLAKK